MIINHIIEMPDELIGKASKANKEDINLCLKSAAKGFEIWKNTSPWERSKIIRKISELIRKRNESLSKWLPGIKF